MDYSAEAKHLPREWESLAISLLSYAKHISGSEPRWENEQWVFRPENFVTFRIQWKRKTGLTLYLRGTKSEHLHLEHMTVTDSVPGYSKIIIDSYEQAFEAFAAIRRAYELYQRGRSRWKRKLVLKEE